MAIRGRLILIAVAVVVARPAFAQAAAPRVNAPTQETATPAVLDAAGSAAATAVSATPKFDVASIHQSKSTDGHHHIYGADNDGQFRTVNLSVRGLLQFAYNVPESQIVGGPGWLDSLTFDVDAKPGPEVDAQMKALPSSQAKLLKQEMVQALLADRFKLVSHAETRQLPVYSLVVANAKKGPKFAPNSANGTTIDMGNEHLHVQGSDNTLTLLTRSLALYLGRVVIDNSGLTGRYDLTLKWTPDSAAAINTALPADAPPDIFTAIQEQLGLKLESTKGPVPVLVIDHAEMPSAN